MLCRRMTDRTDSAAAPRAMRIAWVLALGTSLTQFDVTAAAVALPGIGADLGFGIRGLAWVMDAYSLAFAGMLFVAGALADRFGRLRALRAGNALFLLASLLCGFAWDGPSLWIARALQGVAAAFVVTGGLATVSLAYPAASGERARAFGLIGLIGGVAMALGPSLGGFIAAKADWRWIFLLNLPVCLLAEILYARLLPESRDDAGRRLDIAGVLLLTLAIALPVQALLHEDAGLLWRMLLAVAGLLLALLFAWQQRRRAEPMLDPGLFTRRAALGAGGILLALSLGYWSVLIYLPLFLLGRYGLTAEQGGLAMLAATLPMLALPPLGAKLAVRHGLRLCFLAGLALLALGTGLMAWAAEGAWPLEAMLVAMTVAAAGAGLCNAQASAALMAEAPPARSGMASAMATTLRQGGYALGIAMLGAFWAAGNFSLGFAASAAMAALGCGAAWFCLRD